MMKWFETNNIFLYESDLGLILYSPIARKYVLAKQEHVSAFERYLEEKREERTSIEALDDNNRMFLSLSDYVPLDKQPKVRAPKDYSLLTVLPNNVCNFACSYCYSAAGRNGARLSTDKLKVAIDYFFDSKPESYKKSLTISFMGGGEPMLSWDCVKFGVIYATEKSKTRGIKLNLRIITNGSILDDDTIDFLINYNVMLSVSFEIIPEIQNLQRKHYDLVHKHINDFLNHGIDVQINSTITPANVNRIEEMVEMLHNEFPTITNVMFEPVVSQTMFPTPVDMRMFYDDYLRHIIPALELADGYGISITSFAYLRTVFPLERACPGEFCITADGDITGCYCVSEQHDKLFCRTKYGTVMDGKIIFDIDNYNKLLNENIYSKEECATCKVRWNCGGGCFHQFNNYSKAYQEEVCRFTNKFVELIVKHKVRRHLHSMDNFSQELLPITFKEN